VAHGDTLEFVFSAGHNGLKVWRRHPGRLKRPMSRGAADKSVRAILN